jgi:DNA-3-methyladenine glycosylase II
MKDRKKEIKQFFEKDKILGEIVKSRPLPTLDIYGKKGPFLALLEAIVSQQLSGKSAASLYQKFENFIKDKKDTATFLSKLSLEEIRKIGISNSKAQCIIEVSRMVKNNEIDIEKLAEKSDEEIAERLTKIKGIGIWTVNMFLMFGLKREDIWPCTDFGIRKNLSIILGKKELLSIDETEKIGERWKPYRSYASCYIWNI